jgi:hypothetical protein
MTDALPSAASAAHLTDALRRSGVLADGRVCDVVVKDTRNTILSRIIRLEISYAGAAADAPRALVLKTGHPDRAAPGWNAGRQEVAFYSQVAAVNRTRLVRCFDAQWDAETIAWHLLLEDLTDSHATPGVWPLPPTLAQCETIIRARARFQAAWWDDPRLGTSIGAWTEPAELENYLQRLGNEVTRFADRLGDGLSGPRRQLYERFLAAAPSLLARYRPHRDMTIVQGDSHFWNCFLPKDGGTDVRFFDWDSWRIGVGTADLAYMIAMHWYPDRRREMEQPLLDLHHATLAEAGVRYDRHKLDDDYRQSVLWLLALPVWQAASNIPPVIWWNNLERIMLAIDDLDCRELL